MHFAIGNSMIRQCEFERAMAEYEKVLSMVSKADVETHRNLGQALEARGRALEYQGRKGEELKEFDKALGFSKFDMDRTTTCIIHYTAI